MGVVFPRGQGELTNTILVLIMATRREIRRGAGRSSHNSVRTLPDGAETPWLNGEEWETVYGWLYSSRSAIVEEGLGRVEAWKARGGVPLMIELTADLCHCRKMEKEKSSNGTEVQSLILLYCMAITRFINGVGDVCKQNLGVCADLTTCAHEYGIPSWVVTLRHSGTHQQLPSLGAVRSGAEFCLSWLRVNYWRPQRLLIVKSSGAPRELVVSSNITLDTAMTLTPTAKKSGKSFLDERVTLQTSGLCQSVNELTSLLEKSSYTELAEHLKAQQLLQFSSSSKCSLKVPHRSNLDALPELIVAGKEMKMWSKQFQNVANVSRSFKQRLFSALIVAVHQIEVNSSLQNFLCGWLHFLINREQGVQVKRTGEDEFIEILEEDDSGNVSMPGLVDWQQLLLILIHHPGHYTYPLIKLISCHIHRPEIKKILPEILQMSRMVTVSSRIGDIYSSHCMYQEGDHSRKAAEFMSSMAGPGSLGGDQVPLQPESKSLGCVSDGGYTRGNRWKVVEDVEAWLMCPIGLCPGQTLSPHMFSVIPQDQQLVILEDSDIDDMEDGNHGSDNKADKGKCEVQLSQQELQNIESQLIQYY